MRFALMTLLLVLPLAVSCDKSTHDQASTRAHKGTPPELSAAPSRDAPPAMGQGDRDTKTAQDRAKEKECQALRKAFLDRRAKGPGTCKTSRDCWNAPGGIDDCGQVTDKQTAKDLFVIYNKIRVRCGLERHCAPRVSIPECAGGQCVRATRPYNRISAPSGLTPKRRRPRPR